MGSGRKCDSPLKYGVSVTDCPFNSDLVSWNWNFNPCSLTISGCGIWRPSHPASCPWKFRAYGHDRGSKSRNASSWLFCFLRQLVCRCPISCRKSSSCRTSSERHLADLPLARSNVACSALLTGLLMLLERSGLVRLNLELKSNFWDHHRRVCTRRCTKQLSLSLAFR